MEQKFVTGMSDEEIHHLRKQIVARKISPASAEMPRQCRYFGA